MSQVSPIASKVAPKATVSQPAALLRKFMNCSRWVSLMAAKIARWFCSLTWRARKYITGGSSHHPGDGIFGRGNCSAVAFPLVQLDGRLVQRPAHQQPRPGEQAPGDHLIHEESLPGTTADPRPGPPGPGESIGDQLLRGALIADADQHGDQVLVLDRAVELRDAPSLR